jgi:hypothetical protein
LSSLTITRGFSTRRVYARLMKGRPEEPLSHQQIAVYSRDEYDAMRAHGWKPVLEFQEMIRRALYSSRGANHD